MSALQLLRSRRFGPFFATQFLGAFNDNVFKNAVVVLLAFRLASAEQTDVWVQLAGGLFILPFFLLSAWAGRLADAVDKSRLIRLIKLGEIAIMALGVVAFAVDSMVLLLVVLLLMGAQSTLFGPVKYSILPQHLQTAELMTGNGLVESATFLAVLLGTIAGGLLMGIDGYGAWLVSTCVLGLAILGWFVSLRVPVAPPSEVGLGVRFQPWSESRAVLRAARSDRTVWLAILGISWFWLYGALFVGQFPGYARHVLGGAEGVVTLLLAAFSVGIGIGSMLCARLSRGRIELALVPLGALGLAGFAADLAWATPEVATNGLGVAELLRSPQHLRLLADLTLIGVSGGLYIVPLYALLQHRTEASSRSRIISANNLVNALFMVAASAFAIILRKVGLDTSELFLAAAGATLLVACAVVRHTLESLLYFAGRLVIRSLYRLRTSGLEHLPSRGPALLVCNHVSFIDAVVLAAVTPRPVRFVMDHRIFSTPVLRWIFRLARSIPIAPGREDPVVRERAFEEMTRALRRGELVCIFPEGKITRDGELAPFQRGAERMARTAEVPVVPLALRGLWGSFFSRKYGPAMSRWFARGPRSAVDVACGPPLAPQHVTTRELESRVRRLCNGGPGYQLNRVAVGSPSMHSA